MSRDLCPKCGSSTALGDYRCFKCGYSQRRYTNFALLQPTDTEIELPDEILFNPNNFHPDAIEWLSKAYVFNDMIIEQGIGYCPNIHKVFLPAYDSSAILRFYQLRALKHVDAKIKYLTYGKSSDYLIHYVNQTKPHQLVIVEDHLSAMRLRDHANVVALSGTFLSPDNCTSLVRTYSEFIFWLDPDLPGRQAREKNCKRLKKYGEQYMVEQLFTGHNTSDYRFQYVNHAKIGLDPKYYRDSEIPNILTHEVLLCENS